MKTDEVAEMLAEVINDSYGRTFKLVKREYNDEQQTIRPILNDTDEE